jgi:hypothetical protein
VDKGSQIPKTEANRRTATLGAAPVLAQLPNVSGELPIANVSQRTAPQHAGYRFDPPQAIDRRVREPQKDESQFRTLKSELVYSPRTPRALQPHVFDRARAARRQKPASRRESPILPRSNTFAIPRRGLFDVLAPALQFAMLVALFAAAGTWLQLNIFRDPNALERLEAAKATLLHSPSASAKAVSRPISAPTAVGPIGTTPQSGPRVGRVRANDDFATLRGDVLPVTPPATEAAGDVPALVGPGLPQVQTTELPTVAIHNRLPQDVQAERPAEIASVPGFSHKLPTR